MLLRSLGFVASVTAVAPYAALAQTSTITAGCTLHVWPSAGLNSVYSGFLHGGIVNGAVTGREGYPTVSASPVVTSEQVRLLTESRLAALLDEPDWRVDVHPEALASRVIRATPGRIATDTSGCYAELIVDDVVFRQDLVNGSYLQMSLRYRAFGTGATPERVFGTWVKTSLQPSATARPSDAAAVSADVVQAAYTNNLVLFAHALRKPAKAPR